MAADASTTQKGIELLSQATAADQDKRYPDALQLYQQGIQYLLTAIKYEKNEQLKQILSQRVTEYLARAEALKTFVKAQQEAPPIGAGGGSPSAAGAGTDKYREAMQAAVLAQKPNVHWDDIAGLHAAKEALRETVILPMKFPQLFDKSGPRKPWTGILLYGPPGTGKTELAKAVATEADSTFFTVKTSDLISKWQGDSERLLHALFEAAREKRPAVVFVDEVDSLLPTRNDSVSESIHRFINQFLQEMDGVGQDMTGILVLGATNAPWSIDPAARRRFQKRIYIGLPDAAARLRIFEINLRKAPNALTRDDLRQLANDTEGYSGSDISTVCRDAIMAPVRKVQVATHFKQAVVQDPSGAVRQGFTPCSPGDEGAIEMTWMSLKSHELIEPVITYRDFARSVASTRPTVSQGDLTKINEYTRDFGSDGS